SPTNGAIDANGGDGSACAGRWVPPTRAEIDAGFDEWWSYYPRKEDKLDARKAYAARVSDKDPDRRATIPQLLVAVQAYKFSAERKYIKQPATWLNKGSWQDMLPQLKPPTGAAALPSLPPGWQDNPALKRHVLQLYPHLAQSPTKTNL